MSLPFVDFFRRAPISKRPESLVSNKPYNFVFHLQVFMLRSPNIQEHAGEEFGRTCGILPTGNLEELLDI